MGKSDQDEVLWRGVRRNGLRITLLACFVFLLCYFSAELGGLLEIHVPQPVWLLWPGCAVLVSVLLVVPRDLWAVLIPAGLAAFVVYDLRVGLPVVSILWLIVVDLAEVLVAAVGIYAAFNGKPHFNSVVALSKYSLFALFLAPIITATMGAGVLHGDYWTGWRAILLSEALAFLTLPPAILSWANQLRRWREKPTSHWIEAYVLFTGVFVLGYVIAIASQHSLTPALFYMLIPFLIWSALRFGPLGVSTSIVIVAFLSIWGSIQGRGPFTGSTPLGGVLSLQLFLVCAAIPFMVLAALAEEHKSGLETLQELSGRLITAQEEERARVARELHDDLSQRMALLSIRLERSQQDLSEISTKSHQQLAMVATIANEVSTGLRELSHLLHPASLATLGLVTSVAGFCRDFSKQYDLTVKFEHKDVPKDTPKDISLCIFRIVQEALRNVEKHSAVKEARVTLTGSGDRLDLCIEDSGIGFDSNGYEGKSALGLVSMRERARLVGGQISIESEPLNGTRISLRVPLNRVTPQIGQPSRSAQP